MNDKPDDVAPSGAQDSTTSPAAPPKRTLKLKGPRIERPPAPSLPGTPSGGPPPRSLSSPPPGMSDERPNFLTRIDQVKRQMQADMDALADPKSQGRRRP